MDRPGARRVAGLSGRVLLLSLLLLAACTAERQAPAVPGIVAVTAERIRDEHGLATTRSRVTVTFDGPVVPAESRIPLASHFEFDVLQADGSAKRVLVKTAERSPADRRQVVLEVDALVTRGSTLRVSRRAFNPAAPGVVEAEVGAGLEPVAALLASVALAPADPAFFDPPAPRAIDSAADDPAAMRAALARHLRQRGTDAATIADALAVYDAIPPATVPAPKLRAALAALVGTFAEPALTDLLTAQNCTGLPAASIDFRTPPGNERLLARVTYTGNGARVVSVEPGLRDERFELLMPLLAHEAVHCDQADSRVEEIVATAFDTLLFLQLVAADPSLAQERTRLARELRIDALALINSGGVWPESIGVLRSPGVVQALPGTNADHRSFAEFVVRSYPSVRELQSPTEPLAAAYMAGLASGAGVTAGDPFDLRQLDDLLGRALDIGDLMEVIRAFGLEPAG